MIVFLDAKTLLLALALWGNPPNSLAFASKK